ncbi:laminin subunit gamma-1-like [Mizuhopecten yessoensis]|uniref:Laminin subunit gamma-1 n=1 Tax=Mizuhopecten yessoensis TaxID=6573 RepID=A0A210R1K9_MIZYE|nr:laminin subunit gamma-1-like [Mizuhopecten yessoensis]OWF54908.1 Laminin subunit gamma-1 [Mizuhopecten yessoensis]
MADGARAVKSLSASSRSCGLVLTTGTMARLTLIVLCVGIMTHVTLGDEGLDLDEIERENVAAGSRDCYDANGRPQRCMPEFVNAAYNLDVEASNTCGVSRPIEYCLQTGATRVRKSCHQCNDADPSLRHPPHYMTDFSNNRNWTWWQSETMLQGMQYPNVVNLTLDLKKAYDITYVRLRFHSPRPESFAIYKRTSKKSNWTPYQFYSASCYSTYNLPRKTVITYENEDQAICTDYYSDISPLTGASVPFSTLEGRPSAFEFEESQKLQEWVTATDIKIVLTRMNTFGDEVFGDPQVLKSYFYAISDLAVGARCKCNGHASGCRKVEVDGDIELVCNCHHNTTGNNCEQCLPTHNDRPWGRATERNAQECLRCDCNGKADGCYFDQDLFAQTGHGGYCIDCRDNTDGPKCERCKDNHYRRPEDNMCTPCNCNPLGSEDLQCDSIGRCQCKPGVTSEKCDRCEVGHFDFDQYGCKPCSCDLAGSLVVVNNFPTCNPLDGNCECKELVEGRTCDRCKVGYFNLNTDNEFGCTSCFCYGHSDDCSSAAGYYARSITSDFETGKQRWTAADRANNVIETSYNGILQNIGASADDDQPVYFLAPARYLGDQRFSFNHYLTFDLRIGQERPRPLAVDIVLEGSGQRISTAIYTQSNPMPSIQSQTYRFRLHQHPNYQWTPRLQPRDFIAILSNLTAIKIRATYSDGGVGFLDNVRLDTASLGSNGGEEAPWVEQCTCPEGYVGQFCESCAAGYMRSPVYGGPFSSCVPCQCNSHSQSCAPDSGRCRCEHNTEGQNCERCIKGYYGNPLQGTTDDCQMCPCPNGGACEQLPGGDVVCTECDEGHGGNLCDICLDGYYGDPAGLSGGARPCVKCFCNENVDTNAVGNCDRTTGECLKCIYNTAGFSCGACLPSYYGNALAEEKGDCQACNCYPPGTLNTGGLLCDPTIGQCPCLPHVVGRKCDACEAGYWNLDSGAGCEACDCLPMGSLNNTCQVAGGQCQCKPGVTGRQCDQCKPFYYGFSDTGCTACNCDPEGSTNLQCDNSGNCACQPNIEGQHCDRCKENKYNITAGCLDCPACYSLVQDRVNAHRNKLTDLNNLIINIGNNPSAFNDTEFLSYMNQVNDSVIMLLDEARGAVSDNGTLGRQLSELKMAVKDVLASAGVITSNIHSAEQSSRDSEQDVQQAQNAINRAEQTLQAAETYIDMEGRKALQQAQNALNQFGQQSAQMTEIANKARNESMKQKEEADRIEGIANMALNMSRDARRMAEETLRVPDQTKDDIQRLAQQYEETDRLYNRTKLFADNVKERAKEAYEEALELYADATKIKLPNIDVPTLIGNTSQIKAEASDIKEEAERLIQQNKQLLEDVDSQKGEANALLKSVMGKQQRIDELLAEVDAARAMAREAVDKAEKTLQEANNTLQTLLAFDKDVQNSKGEADAALQKIPQIQDMIQEAENKTKEASDALTGAENDANMALSLARQAQDTAQNASQAASRIRAEADVTKDRAMDLKDEADNLAGQVNTTDVKLTNLESQADEDSRLIDEALQKAAQAKNDAKNVSEQVIAALGTVQNISRLLGQLDDVDIAKLDALQAALDNAEQELIDADLDNQYMKLEKANDEIKRLVAEHENDYNMLKEDVDNIEQIKLSLPDGCFKNIDIESPPGQ